MWGNLSDAFSRRVIRNYLCKIEIDLKARNSKLQVLIITSIAAIHKYGKNFKQREPAIFGGMVTRRILNSKFIAMYILMYKAMYVTL